MAEFLSGPNYLKLPYNDEKWLIDRLIPTAGLFSLNGESKAGKSFCMLDMAEAISNPLVTHWNGFAVLDHGPVMFLQIDTPRTEWRDRMDRFTRCGKDFSNVYLADMGTIPTFPFDILDPQSAEWLRAEVTRLEPALVIIDTMRDMNSGDENDSTAVRNVLLTLIKATTPAACGLLVHSKKATQFSKLAGAEMDTVRGSSAFVAKMDNVLTLTKTRLSWKGRAGEEQVCVRQLPKYAPTGDEALDGGLFVLDGASALEEAAVARVVQMEQQKNPKVSIQACGRALCAELKWESSRLKSATRRVKIYMKNAA